MVSESSMYKTLLIPNLLSITEVALTELSSIIDRVKIICVSRFVESQKSEKMFVEEHQTFNHTIAWLCTYYIALERMQKWSLQLKMENRLGEVETLIHQIAFSEYLAQIKGGIPISQGEIVRLNDIEIDVENESLFKNPDIKKLINLGASQDCKKFLISHLSECSKNELTGDTGLTSELNMIRDQFRRFSNEKVDPFAQNWHLNDELIPMNLIQEMADLGVFGMSIPEQYGGLGLSKIALCVVSEELSRGYIGVGSLGTRSDIAAELILCGGTDDQKRKWLPKIANGEILPTAVFTEPNTGSDLGALTTKAIKFNNGYKITGNKTWITHGSRAQLMTVLTRTSRTLSNHKGLSMFLAEKTSGNNDNFFPDTGLTGGEIQVIGYRGMKEFELSFDEFYVPKENLLGEKEGFGFNQLMQTFESARIQTASRAIGITQSACELAIKYANDRHQFGKKIIKFPRVYNKLAMMVVELMVSRQLTYYAAEQKDNNKRCDLEAGMAKLLSSRVAWSAADNSLQIHGSYGYALEHPASRLLCDARIINIFEGTAEIQANVISRRILSNSINEKNIS